MGDPAKRLTRCPFYTLLFVAISIAPFTGCGLGKMSAVSPEEMPALEQRIAEHPEDGAARLRYAAALFAANQCDSAVVMARTGIARRPNDALGPLVIGQCLEQAGNHTDAISEYNRFLDANPEGRGSASVQARILIAQRDQATAMAREALRLESEQAQVPTDPEVVAVLPLQIVGDSQYQPLSLGLAQIITSDLALLQRFRMVERLQLSALLEELQLGQTERVDQASAARVGRLVRAGRMVQGLAAIPEDGDTRLEASVVMSDGEVRSPGSLTGRLRDLLQMEKQLVVAIASQLGYTLSQAELQLILENGTQNMTAFLAYSEGLLAEDAGDYSAAAAHFARAVRADPNFQAARDGFQAAEMAPEVEAATATEVTEIASAAPSSEPSLNFGLDVGEVAVLAMDATEQDIAPTLVDQLSQMGDQNETPSSGTGNNAAVPPPPDATTPSTTGIIRIIFRLP